MNNENPTPDDDFDIDKMFDEETDDELSDEDYSEEEVGERIMSTTDRETDNGLDIRFHQHALRDMAVTVAERLREKLEPTIKKIVEAKLDEVLNDQWHATVGEQANKAILEYLEKPRRKTNSYGEPTGDTTMLSAKIPETIIGWLQQRVDSDGRDRTDNYNRESYPTRVDFLLKKMVTEQLSSEIKKSVDDVTVKARQLVAGQVGRFVSEQMIPSIELKS